MKTLGGLSKVLYLMKQIGHSKLKQKLGPSSGHTCSKTELVGNALWEGLNLAIETAPASRSKKEEFRSNIGLLSLECLKNIFSGACSVEPTEFLKVVRFSDSITQQQQTWFAVAIDQMTNAERTRLAIFITGLEFFSNSSINVELLDREDEPCIQSNTCFNILSLPLYKSLENMLRKINYSTMDTSYGRP
jgi:hypothetical protein